MDEQAPPPDIHAFPAESLVWLVGPAPQAVLVLDSPGLAFALTEAGHDVHSGPFGGRPAVPQHSVDVVVARQRVPEDLMEVARVLRPGGHLALAVTDRDHRIPWARKLDRALGLTPAADPTEVWSASALFDVIEEAHHRTWQSVNRDSLSEVIEAIPELAGLDGAERARRAAAAIALYDDYGRGADGMQLPWLCRCFRATVLDGAYVPPPAAAPPPPPEAAPTPTAPADAVSTWVGEDTQPIGVVPAGPSTAGETGTGRFTFHAGEFDDSALLLIDLR